MTCSTTAQVDQKRGDTLSWTCTYRAVGETVGTSLSGATVTSKLRRTSEAVAAVALTVTLANQLVSPGVFTVSALPATTATLLLGVYVCDIEILFPDTSVRSTRTFNVNVEADVTRP